MSTQHFYFRRARYSSYDVSMWNMSSLLPPGIAALFAFGGGIAMAILGMDQVVRLPFLLTSTVLTREASSGGEDLSRARWRDRGRRMAETSDSSSLWRSRRLCILERGRSRRRCLGGRLLGVLVIER